MKEWSVDEIYDMVIEGSDTDMIVAQPLPLTDLFHDGLSPGRSAPRWRPSTPTARSSGARSTRSRARRRWT